MIEKTLFYNADIRVLLTRYKNVHGWISLCPPTYFTMNAWEIYCLEGDLFEDVERFDTIEEAENRIRELLKDNNINFVSAGLKK